ncbi:MAG TPA: DUF4142 domain-containing protein [Magnetospirillum sp.]|jgi:putative membrane protein|nr:DUF4142 domain-containing protein [Magnetospirillum sp.]
MRATLSVMALTVALAALPATAADKPKLSHQDRNFVEDAQAGGIMEVQLGQLASERAQSQDVKDFGSHMVTDHSKVNQQLDTITNKMGMSPPNELPREQRRQVDKLSKLNGAEFDRAYIATMVDDHKKDIGAFRKQADKGENAELKNFAQATTPTLEQHLQAAEDIQAKIHGQQAQVPR